MSEIKGNIIMKLETKIEVFIRDSQKRKKNSSNFQNSAKINKHYE